MIAHFGQGAFQSSQGLRTRILYYLCLNALPAPIFFVSPIYYYFRKNYWQLGSYFYRLTLMATSSGEKDELLASILGVSLDVWTCHYIWGTYLLSLHINLGFMHTFKTTIQLLMDNSFRPKEQIRIYSKLRILTTVFNNAYGMFYIPSLKNIFGVLVSAAVFILVRLAPKSDVQVAIFGGLCASSGIILLTMFILFTAMITASSSEGSSRNAQYYSRDEWKEGWSNRTKWKR